MLWDNIYCCTKQIIQTTKGNNKNQIKFFWFFVKLHDVF